MNSSIIKLAIANAEQSTHLFRIGAVIFKGKKIFSTGYNEVRTCSGIPARYRKHWKSLHAEQKAVLNAKRDVSNTEMLVIRLSKSGNLLLAKPCYHCTVTLDHVGVHTVYYSDTNGQIVKVRVQELMNEYLLP